MYVYKYIQGLGQSRLSTADHALLLVHTDEFITCPVFIPRCEPNSEHYVQQFMLPRFQPLLCKSVLIP
jgi:hypothetical protein